MEIKQATKIEKENSLKIAQILPKWFSKEGVKNMAIDFEFNHVTVMKDQNEIVGFICFTSYCGTMQILWMAVHPDMQRNGIGEKLLKWLEDETNKIGLRSMQVETLSDEEDYEPYERTRNFYYKNDFKKVFSKKATIEGWDDQIILEKILK